MPLKVVHKLPSQVQPPALEPERTPQQKRVDSMSPSEYSKAVAKLVEREKREEKLEAAKRRQKVSGRTATKRKSQARRKRATKR